MADEEANANENIEPKQKDFYGFALYTYNARRYARYFLFIFSLFYWLLVFLDQGVLKLRKIKTAKTVKMELCQAKL